jgi:hypothetical protein
MIQIPFTRAEEIYWRMSAKPGSKPSIAINPDHFHLFAF